MPSLQRFRINTSSSDWRDAGDCSAPSSISKIAPEREEEAVYRCSLTPCLLPPAAAPRPSPRVHVTESLETHATSESLMLPPPPLCVDSDVSDWLLISVVFCGCFIIPCCCRGDINDTGRNLGLGPRFSYRWQKCKHFSRAYFLFQWTQHRDYHSLSLGNVAGGLAGFSCHAPDALLPQEDMIESIIPTSCVTVTTSLPLL